MKVAIIGPGNVGRALGVLAAGKGHEVVLGVRDANSDSTREALGAIAGATTATPAEAAERCDVALLTVPWAAAKDVVPQLGDAVVVDCTNPIAAGPRHAIGDRSGAEVLAEVAPSARLVKAFNVYGVENLGDPDFGAVRGMLPVAGDDGDAKQRVVELARSMGWEPLDVGPLSLALQLEHLALLWIHMARVQGRDARFVWSRVTDGRR